MPVICPSLLPSAVTCPPYQAGGSQGHYRYWMHALLLIGPVRAPASSIPGRAYLDSPSLPCPNPTPGLIHPRPCQPLGTGVSMVV